MKNILEEYINKNKILIFHETFKIGIDFMEDKKNLKKYIIEGLEESLHNLIGFILSSKNSFDINKDLNIRNIAILLFNYIEFYLIYGELNENN